MLTQFKHDAQGAIVKLKELKTGEAVAALHHPEIGDIDLVWGEEGAAEKDYEDGYGLAKIIKKHPEVIEELQPILSDMAVIKKSGNRAVLESDKYKAVVRLEWEGKSKQWLLTEFEKEESGIIKRTGAHDVAGSDSPNHQTLSDSSITPDTDNVNTPKTTPAAVVKEAIATAKGEGTTLKKQKELLLENIDKAIEEAPEELPSDFPKGTRSFEQARERGLMVTIRIPDDGTFEVYNTKTDLAKFKEQVNKEWPKSKNHAIKEASDGLSTSGSTLVASLAQKGFDQAIQIYGKPAKAIEKMRAAVASGAYEFENTKQEKVFNEIIKKLEDKASAYTKTALRKDGDKQSQALEKATTPPSKIATVEKTNSKIADFGEKIGGAKKDLYTARLDEAKKLDIATVPFSKSWPEPDYEKLLEQGIPSEDVDLVRALRDEIPDKPRKSYQVKSWVMLVQNLRGHAERVLNGEKNVVRTVLDRMVADERTKSRWERGHDPLVNISNRAELYTAVGHGISLKGVTLSQNHYGLYMGKENVTLWQVEQKQKPSIFGNMPKDLGSGETKEQAIENFKKNISALIPESTSRATKFIIYTKRGETGFYIGKQLGKNYIDLEKFDTAKEARAYLSENNQALADKLKGLTTLPSERKASNTPRVGQDWRNGKDVTPEMFNEAFVFRGTEFGNYLNDADRQRSLNEAYDALHDIAAVLNVPTQALSLNGELGMAFGARGHGGKNAATAHYEPTKVVINLTKENGAGSLAHELFHALDSYLSRSRGYANDFITDHPVKYGPNDHTRQELIDAFITVKKAIDATKLKNRSLTLDATRSKPYWSTGIEMHARAFENYIIEKLAENGASNDYLANISSMQEYADALLQGMLSGKEAAEMYPYLLPDEIPAVNKAFDNLFKTIKTTPNGKGSFTLNNLGLQSLYERLANTKLTKDAKEDLNRLGAHIYEQGARTWKEWFNAMKEFLGSSFHKFRATMEKMYAKIKENRGSLSPNTKAAYEKRIDELFKPGAKANMTGGVRVVDSSDVLGLLGYGKKPLELVEGKVIKGISEHPLMTAEQWKKIPTWLESPAFVFDSEREPGRLVFIAKDLVGGNPVLIIVSPGDKTNKAHIVINAYDKDGEKGQISRWIDNGLLRYYTKSQSAALDRSRLQLPSLSQARRYDDLKIYRDSDLVKYRNNDSFFASKLKDNRGLVGSDINDTLSPAQWQQVADATGISVQEAKELLGYGEPVAEPILTAEEPVIDLLESDKRDCNRLQTMK